MRLSCLILLLAMCVACSRARVTTDIKRNGAYTRTIALSGQEKNQGAPPMGLSIEENFVIPPPGPLWQSHEEKDTAVRTLTYERTLPAGADSKGDLSLNGGDTGALKLTNEVTVRRLSPGRFEYHETLRWLGPPPANTKIKPEDLALVKATLPPALASDQAAQALSDKIYALSVPLLFGPGDPLLALGLIHPDLAGLRARQRLGSLVMKALEEQFGDKLPLAERRQAARKLIETTFARAMPAKPDASAGPPTNTGGLVPLTFILTGTGKVISSNGEVDDLTGEVYWCLFPEAASLQPVNLTAIIQY